VAPSVDCTCGIYALKQVADTETPNNLRRRGFSVWTKQYKFIHDDPAAIYLPLTDTWYKVQGTLLGVTELWGKIIVAEKGYRAEYGRLRALVCAPFDEIATGYEVPNLPSTDYAREEYFA
jgi:hypothetical protein